MHKSITDSTGTFALLSSKPTFQILERVTAVEILHIFEEKQLFCIKVYKNSSSCFMELQLFCFPNIFDSQESL